MSSAKKIKCHASRPNLRLGFMQFSHLWVNCVLPTSTPRNGKMLNHRHNSQHLRPSSLEFPLVSSIAIVSFGSLLMVQYIEVQCRYGYKGPYILKQPQEFQIAYYQRPCFHERFFRSLRE